MATYYVRKTGNDTTGTGTSGAPWLTVNKAVTASAAGDTILVGPGTYAEDSGSGYLNLTSKTSLTTIAAEQDASDPVIITGTGTTYAAIIAGSQWWIDGITFRAVTDAAPAAFRIAASVTNVLLSRCTFIAVSKSGTVNAAAITAFSGSGLTLTAVRFVDCDFEQTGPFAAAGLNFDATTSADALEIRNCRFNTSGSSMVIPRATNVRILHNTANAWHPSQVSYGLLVGADNTSGSLCSGIVAGNTLTTKTGHALIVGAGCDGVLVVDNRVDGGDDPTDGQGLVVKGCQNVRVIRNLVTSGYKSGIYFKAASNCQAIENIVYNKDANSNAIMTRQDSQNGAACSNITARRNTLHAVAGKAISWGGAADDSGGSVVDENVYITSGAGALGDIRGTTVASVSALRAAWSGYNRPSNDRNSRVGATHAAFAGTPIRALPA